MIFGNTHLVKDFATPILTLPCCVCLSVFFHFLNDLKAKKVPLNSWESKIA